MITCLFYAISSTVFIFMLALVGVFYPYNRGALFTALVVIYALTSGIAGYTATSFYCQLEGTNWVIMDTIFYAMTIISSSMFMERGRSFLTCFYFEFFWLTGEEFVAYRVPILWATFPHFLFP